MRERLELAYIKKMPHVLTDSALFVRIRGVEKSAGVDIVLIRWVESIVGILTCRDSDYVVWPDGCIAEQGRY